MSLERPQGMKPSSGWRGHTKTEAVTILLRAIRVFIALSETESNCNGQDQYSDSCQDIRKFASYTGNTRLMSKTNCHVKLPGFLDY